MTWLLRSTASISLLWALALFFGLERIASPAEISPTALALANGLAAGSIAFAFAFWRAATEVPPNRTVIYTAILLLVLKTSADLYALLVLLRGGAAMVSLADLVVSVGLAVGIIESLPRTFGAVD